MTNNFYYDCEFLEGTQKTLFGKTKPTIDLISIGIVSKDNREYYAISKDFNLKEAWNRYDLKPDIYNGGYKKVYWIRENVLLPIYIENVHGDMRNVLPFTYDSMKWVLKKYGKTNKQIAYEVVDFVYPEFKYAKMGYDRNPLIRRYLSVNPNRPTFYGYYSAYDHVALCWLFGKMIDLPNGFPMYTRDLKQILDEYVEKRIREWGKNAINFDMLTHVKTLPNYPKQTNEHSAIHDAMWNKKLHEFLLTL